MRLIYIVQLAALNIYSKSFRTILTVSGIMISVAIIVFMAGIGYGLQNIVTFELSKSQSTKVVSVSPQRRQLKIDQAVTSKFQSITGVNSVERSVSLSGKVVYHGTALVLPIYGVTKGFFEATPVTLAKGEVIKDTNFEKTPVVVNQIVLKGFSIENADDAIGKEVDMDFVVTADMASKQTENQKVFVGNKYQIVGIINEGSTPIVYVPISDLEKLGVDSASQAKVIVENTDKISEVRQTIEQMGFRTANVLDTLNQVDKIFRILRILLACAGIITLFVAVLGTLNTITISLAEQTPEIGFLRILGIKQDNVSFLFIAESILLSLTGTTAGIIAGIFAGWVINLWTGAATRNLQVTLVRLFALPFWIPFGLIIFAFGLGWLIGITPAKRAVRIDPLKALRH